MAVDVCGAAVAAPKMGAAAPNGFCCCAWGCPKKLVAGCACGWLKPNADGVDVAGCPKPSGLPNIEVPATCCCGCCPNKEPVVPMPVDHTLPIDFIHDWGMHSDRLPCTELPLTRHR